MSKYLRINYKWQFLTKEGRTQFKSFFYKIYINIFGIFLMIPILPMGIHRIGFDFWYRGDTVIWSWKKRKWISCYFSGTGEFGDACFDTLKDLDKYYDASN